MTASREVVDWLRPDDLDLDCVFGICVVNVVRFLALGFRQSLWQMIAIVAGFFADVAWLRRAHTYRNHALLHLLRGKRIKFELFHLLNHQVSELLSCVHVVDVPVTSERIKQGLSILAGYCERIGFSKNKLKQMGVLQVVNNPEDAVVSITLLLQTFVKTLVHEVKLKSS